MRDVKEGTDLEENLDPERPDWPKIRKGRYQPGQGTKERPPRKVYHIDLAGQVQATLEKNREQMNMANELTHAVAEALEAEFCGNDMIDENQRRVIYRTVDRVMDEQYHRATAMLRADKRPNPLAVLRSVLYWWNGFRRARHEDPPWLDRARRAIGPPYDDPDFRGLPPDSGDGGT